MEVRARYDEIADFYAETTGDDADDPVARALLALTGDVAGREVLDLACGHGRLSRELARGGARVVGVDISLKLLERGRALEAEAPLGVRYEEGDASALVGIDDGRFDVVCSNYGLSDIEELDGTLAAAGRVLRSGGVLAFSILHPCFPGRDADAPSAWPPDAGYYEEGWWLADNPGFRGVVGSHFRMLSTYLNGLVDHGFTIDRVAEPKPPVAWAERAPERAPMPFALVVRAVHGAR